MVEKSRSIGIMQGRLTESKGRGIQFFPFEEWKEEFKKAQKIELDEIEWIFDYYNYQDNPLWTKEGRSEICKLVSDTGIRVNSICWDYFMRRPFYKYNSTEVLDENKAQRHIRGGMATREKYLHQHKGSKPAAGFLPRPI